ncbi:MAG: nuclear transport factor 2 family protein [Pseudomonadota bacterium]
MITRIALSCFLLVAGTSTVFADDSGAVDRWYKALRSNDRAAFAELMTEDARVFLNQLGVVQSREEFIESLDVWEEVSADVQIYVSLDRVDEERLVATVCYQFPENSYTNSEMFSFDDGKIFQQVQERIQEGC